ncbi:Protein of unknown function [Gryllus bimaculatus]|nr:Protein of unknown function [Gryllus bimaculatus]
MQGNWKEIMPFMEVMLQIKEEPPEEKGKEENESQEGIEGNEDEEMQRPVAVYLPVKVEPEDEEDKEEAEEEEEEVNRSIPEYHPLKVEQEEENEEEKGGAKEENAEEDDEELAHPVAVFLMTKEEPKEEVEEEDEDPADFSDASVSEEISESGGELPKAAVRDTILEGVLSLISPSSRIENNYDCDAPGKPKGRENVTEDILKIEIPTDQAFNDWSRWNPKKLSHPASQPLQFATNGHISSTVSEASDDPLTEHLFVTQAVSTSSPCSSQAAVEGHPPTPIMLLHPSSSIPIPSSSNTTELITTPQSKSSPPLQIRYRMSAWRGRRRPASPTAAAPPPPPPPSPSQSAEEVSRALLQARLDLVELKKKLVLEEHEWKKELHREQMLEQKLRNRLLLLEMETSVEDQWHPVQIKEEPQEGQDIDENGLQEEKKEPFTNLEEVEEQQEGTGENEEEEVAPVAVFLMSKEEPKEEDEEEVEGPSGFSDASEKKEEISESSGREFTVEGTSSDLQTLMRSTIGQHSREETHHCSICQKSISKERWTGHMKIHSGEKNEKENAKLRQAISASQTVNFQFPTNTPSPYYINKPGIFTPPSAPGSQVC